MAGNWQEIWQEEAGEIFSKLLPKNGVITTQTGGTGGTGGFFKVPENNFNEKKMKNPVSEILM